MGTAGDRIGLADGEAGPGAVIIPAPAVLVGQPGRRPGDRADLCGGDRAAFSVGVTTTSWRPCPASRVLVAASVVVLPAPAAPSITTRRRRPASAVTAAACPESS